MSLLNDIARKSTIKQAFEAGRDCGLNGPNEKNCDFRLFCTPEHTSAWENGRDVGKAKLKEKVKG
jgi:hypothetical protein